MKPGRRAPGWVLAAFCLAAASAGAADLESRPLPLADALRQHLAQPAFAHAQWGLDVAWADTGAPLLRTNEAVLLKPASNAKLFTAALALDLFGPDGRIQTDLIPTGELSDRGTLRGDLVVFGRGDFSFAERFRGPGDPPVFDRLSTALTAAGIRRLRGGVVADDSQFRGSPFGTGWTFDDLQYYYGAPVSALLAEDSVIDVVVHPGPREGDAVRLQTHPDTTYLTFDLGQLRTGPATATAAVEWQRELASREVKARGMLPAGGPPVTNAIPVPEPALFFAHLLTEHLERRGIRVGSAPRTEPGSAKRAGGGSRLTVSSPPMAALVRGMLKPSQNQYAQLLLWQAGAALAPAGPDEASEDAGVRALGLFLDRIGIPRREVRLDEGSGLSRSALVTPRATLQLLQAMDRHPAREAFLDALPVAGIDGSLRRRFPTGPARGNLRAKTGTLRYVNTLCGFVTNAAGHRIVFAAFLNAYEGGPDEPSGRTAVEGIGALLAASQDRPDTAAAP